MQNLTCLNCDTYLIYTQVARHRFPFVYMFQNGLLYNLTTAVLKYIAPLKPTTRNRGVFIWTCVMPLSKKIKGSLVY